MTQKFSFYNVFFDIPENNKYFVFNSYSKALLELEDTDYNLLKSSNNTDSGLNELKEDKIEILKRNGIIVNKELDEKKEVRKMINNDLENIYKSKDIMITFAPTLNCNMKCLYCFEGEKDTSITKTDSELEDSIIQFLSKIIREGQGEIKHLNFSWFGGEPLLKQKLIRSLSEKLIKLCGQHNIEYQADITTNGLLLNKETWKLLKECTVKTVQVTLDGSRETHNTKRLLKNNSLSSDCNYNQIIKNLKFMPKGFKLNIRLNADKEVVSGLDNLLDDLSQHQIWPHRAREVNLDFGVKFHIPNVCKEDKSIFFSLDEYYHEKELFRYKKFEYYNNWAKQNNEKLAKVKFDYPSKQKTLCGTARNPNAFVIDNKGYIYKCWMMLNIDDKRLDHIDNNTLNIERYKDWTFFNKYDFSTECQQCKFLPVCNQDCPREHFDNEVVCSEWRYVLKRKIQNYLDLLSKHPEQIVISEKLTVNI